MDVAGVSIDLARVSQSRKVVLVEGGSDKAALEVLAQRRGQVPGRGGIYVVAVGGASNIGHFLELLGPHGINARLGGLCDAAEGGYVRCAALRPPAWPRGRPPPPAAAAGTAGAARRQNCPR
jgi:hypothetical protein